MMGIEAPTQSNLFYTNFNLNSRVRSNHPLRKISAIIDFNFAYEVVADSYGNNGNVSVPPPVLLKLMLLLVLYNVRSERELISTLPERLDWLLFLGYDIDSTIPNHSVLSKARSRWGARIFQSFFERIVFQCVKAGLVDGKKIFMDSSLIEANASLNSIIDSHSLKRHLNKRYKELGSRLDEIKENEKDRPSRKMNNRYVSTTDPEAGLFRNRKTELCYKTHRAVEEKSEIITAVEVTAGDINEGHHLKSLHEKHKNNTEIKADTIVADSQYGTRENYIFCHDNGIEAHIPDFKAKSESGSERKSKKSKRKKIKIFSDSLFKYNAEEDVYICPANKILKKRHHITSQGGMKYCARKKECFSCELRSQCTKSKVGRSINRNLQQDVIDKMRQNAQAMKSKKDIDKRKHLMERSFAHATRYRFDRARWRGLSKVLIQELLICSIQNIQNLIKPRTKPKRAFSMSVKLDNYEIKSYPLIQTDNTKMFIESDAVIAKNIIKDVSFLRSESWMVNLRVQH